jgi:hypothetical protein
VLRCFGSACEGAAEFPTTVRPWVSLERVQAVLTGLELPNHVFVLHEFLRSTPTVPRAAEHYVGCCDRDNCLNAHEESIPALWYLMAI